MAHLGSNKNFRDYEVFFSSCNLIPSLKRFEEYTSFAKSGGLEYTFDRVYAALTFGNFCIESRIMLMIDLKFKYCSSRSG